MKKEIWLIIILGVVIVALVGVLAWPKPSQNQQQNLQVGDGIEITLPIANTEITSPLEITGKVTGNGWAGFEGQVGTVKLLDYKSNVLASGILTATSEWTTLPTYFKTILTFTSANSGPATLVFINENPSGDPAKDKNFIIPVKIK